MKNRRLSWSEAQKWAPLNRCSSASDPQKNGVRNRLKIGRKFRRIHRNPTVGRSSPAQIFLPRNQEEILRESPTCGFRRIHRNFGQFWGGVDGRFFPDSERLESWKTDLKNDRHVIEHPPTRQKWAKRRFCIGTQKSDFPMRRHLFPY